MCVIFSLSPSQMIGERKLYNAVANNLHGYGILMYPNGRSDQLEVLRGYEADGIDHEKVLKILDDKKDYVRHVHLRNMTHGSVSEDNVHPFKVFESKERTVYLAHNGSFFDYKPENGDDRNDTRIFCDKVVSPLLSKFEGEWGRGDYNDPLFRDIMKKFIGVNRLLLVSNDLIPGYFGDWKDIDDEEGGKFKASNNDYFNYVTRGPRKLAGTFFQATQQTTTTVVTSDTGSNNTKTNTGTNLVVVSKRVGDGDQKSKVSPPWREVSETTEEREAKIKTTNEEIVNLNTISRTRPVFEPSLELLKVLGSWTAEMWEENHFSMIGWAKDDEIVAFLNRMSSTDKVQLLRDLINSIEDLESELGQNEGIVIEAEEQIRELIGTNVTLSREVEALKAEVRRLSGVEIQQEAA